MMEMVKTENQMNTVDDFKIDDLSKTNAHFVDDTKVYHNKSHPQLGLIS